MGETTRAMRRGRILYTSDRPERLGRERGREFFTLLSHVDGSRSLQAHSEIDDDPSVIRLVTSTLSGDWQPRDAFVRIVVRDRFMGSTWYRFQRDHAECEGFTAEQGRFTQRLELDQPIDGFGAHPLQNDAWVCAAVDTSRGPCARRLNLLLSSADHRGATGPTLVPIQTDVEFLGRESVSVAAGVFEALHFRFGQDGGWAADDPLKHPTYHLWCTADGEYVFLKGYVTGYMQTRYELVEFEHTTR